ncbi:ScbA/BarX family gamma-butyrolactone biosynthesis protein [Streptomyces cavernae]|uniref:ScbA/BarX family gamma-butyrolactone biosynthesis protein n=1 Tax=Streptomyces cavernae TaxID=2259034 RepID=UPI000FEBF0B5|nr:ScbA/BarX family gamma-butyrolactone biosynthesis protein [Streptomyces cavernae]
MSETAYASRPSNRYNPAPHAKSSLLGPYTHLKRQESVLVANWRRRGSHTFTLDLKWPAVQGDLPYDPRILAQSIRQSGLVIAHAEYDVPLDHQTILKTLDFTVAPGFRVPRGRPSILRVEVDVSAPQLGRRTPNALHMALRILHGTTTVAQVESGFGWISPPVYRRLRGEYAATDWAGWQVPPPTIPELVARPDAVDVVLSPGDRANRWLLRNVVANTVLFDHAVDHVPGLVLLEAAQQAAHALLAPDVFAPTRIATRYSHYVEFDQPCWIEAESLPAPAAGVHALRVRGVQGDKTAFTVDLDGTTQ